MEEVVPDIFHVCVVVSLIIIWVFYVIGKDQD